MSRTVIITGGGTAGHTNPGIAIAQALVARGLDPGQVHFVGGERGNEGTLVPAAGFSIDLLPGRGLQRAISATALRDNGGAVLGLFRALGQARSILRHRKPGAVVCLGGYAAFAATAVALLARIPVIVSEQNAKASAVNRLLGRFATVCTLPYPDTDLPHGALTGNPIRSEVVAAIAATDRLESRIVLGVPAERKLLVVWSGSLGARRVNDLTVELARRWRDRSDVAIHHVVGRRDWPDFAHVPDEFAAAPLHYQAVEYEDRMPSVLSAADVAITRAGASTTAELAVAGLPAIMVPLPGAPRDHQRANAAELVAAGGGLCVLDADADADTIEAKLTELFADPERLRAMAAAARSVARPDAADAVAQLVLENLR